MSYKLIDANNIAFNSDGFITAENIVKMPCIYADLPNGMDGEHYVLEQEPKTGHWKKWEYGTHRCSICDKFIGRERYPYCPYCGAKMVESQEGDEE